MTDANEMLSQYLARSKANREQFAQDSSRLVSVIAGGSDDEFNRVTADILGFGDDSGIDDRDGEEVLPQTG